MFTLKKKSSKIMIKKMNSLDDSTHYEKKIILIGAIRNTYLKNGLLLSDLSGGGIKCLVIV